MKFILFISRFVGNEMNASYPKKTVCDTPDSFKEAVRYDHVCAKYKGNYRSNENFMASQCLVMDCDNDHTEVPEEWITPGALEEEYQNVPFAVTFSRHHMQAKDDKGPRPRFHVYFQIPVIKDPVAYSNLKRRIQQEYPFFDDGAIDAGRFIYGAETEKVYWHEGTITVDQFINDAAPSIRTIPQGRRNSTMSRFAGRAVKRYGWNGFPCRSYYSRDHRRMAGSV